MDWNRREKFYGVGIVLVGPIDLVTTFLLVEMYGVSGEINPLMKFALESGFLLPIIIKLAEIAFISAVFWAFILLIENSSGWEKSFLQLQLKSTLGFVILFGTLTVLNNTLLLLAGFFV
jgi:hypothetical protein